MAIREQVSWTKSLYKQVVLNSPTNPYNATALKYEEFCQLPKIVKLANIAVLKDDLKTGFGAKELVSARYEADWLQVFANVLGIADISKMPLPIQANTSVSDDLVELVRQINAMQLPTYTRARFLSIIQDCCKSNHTQLRKYKKPPGSLLGRVLRRAYSTLGLTFFPGCSSMQIVRQLVPETSAQVEFINELTQFIINKPRFI